MLIGLSAWAPPFKIFIIGTGNLKSLLSDRYSYSFLFSEIEAAFAIAIDTANIAFAPSLLLFSVPSNSTNILSISDWLKGLKPIRDLLISVLMLLTAFITPIPLYLLSPSRNSTASCIPVEAPEGTEYLD